MKRTHKAKNINVIQTNNVFIIYLPANKAPPDNITNPIINATIIIIGFKPTVDAVADYFIEFSNS
tara:strand:+ start:1568 stop:1762 length:195 start_codon:yes stop_codon:yes gene_type:complete